MTENTPLNPSANGAGDIGDRMDVKDGEVLTGKARRRPIFVNGGRSNGKRRRQSSDGLR